MAATREKGVINARVDAVVVEALQARADAEERSLAAVARIALREFVERHEAADK